jgi:mannitol-1-phosphate/altronate dehydrogenase
MLHIHFGTGRLGLGLVAPFFQTPNSELYLLNRAVAASKPTGSTALSPARRNELLRDNPDRCYVVDAPNDPSAREVVRYDEFFAYDDENLNDIIRTILEKSTQKERGVIVTAAVLKTENYASVLQALDLICEAKEQSPDSIGKIALVACENTVSACEVLEHPSMAERVTPRLRCHVTCVHALVDRLCVGLEEDHAGAHPMVRACAEPYGSLKLQLSGDTEGLVDMLQNSRIEFSRYLHTEKQIKSWLLNGSHWLIALRAFHVANGDHSLTLNRFLNASPNNQRFAAAVLDEMREGVSILLRSTPEYTDFVQNVDVDDYLAGAAKMILKRFGATDDPITRILARFREPTPDEFKTIEAFNERFAGRVDEPMMAYEAAKGVIPPAASQSIFSLHRLVATGTYVDASAH